MFWGSDMYIYILIFRTFALIIRTPFFLFVAGKRGFHFPQAAHARLHKYNTIMMNSHFGPIFFATKWHALWNEMISTRSISMAFLCAYFGCFSPVESWAPVSEPGFIHLSKMFRKFGILEEFLKMVFKNGLAQYRRIIIGKLMQNWFPIRRLVEPKNNP